METGQNAKMDTIGVWDFEEQRELRENNATYIVEKSGSNFRALYKLTTTQSET